MHYGHSKQIRKSTGLGISGMIKVNKVSAIMTALLSGMYTLLNMKHMSHVYVCHSWHLYPFPTWHSFDLLSSCVKSIPHDSSVSWLWSGKAWSHTSLAQYVLVCPFLLSIYLFLLLSTVCFPMSHHLLPSTYFSVSSSVPRLCSPLFSSIFIPYLCWPYLVILYFPYDPFLIIQIISILTTSHTYINTLATSCCSSVW